MIEQVDDGGRQARGRAEGQAQDDVAQLADAGIGEQPPQVGLEDRDRRGHEHAGQRQHQHGLLHRQLVEHGRATEHREIEAQQHVDRHLGGRGGQERRHRRRREGIGVGQPLVQREQRQLQRDAHREEGQRRQHRPRALHGGEALAHVGHVQRARHQVREADADDEEGGTDRAHDQVLVGRHQPAAVAPERDQHVGGQRRHLQEHEDVEGVAGDGDAQQPGQAQQEHRVEQIVLLRRHLGLDAGPAVGQHHRRDAGHEHQNEGAERIDPVFDAPGRWPAADGIGDRAALAHLQPQQHGDRQGRPAGRQRRGIGQAAPAQQHRQRCGQQRHDHLQGRQMRGQAHGDGAGAAGGPGCASCSRISSSSMLP